MDLTFAITQGNHSTLNLVPQVVNEFLKMCQLQIVKPNFYQLRIRMPHHLLISNKLESNPSSFCFPSEEIQTKNFTIRTKECYETQSDVQEDF